MIHNGSSRAAACASAICILSGLSLTVPALAEESDREAGAYIEEVIVTARKREESVQDVPVAITAFSSELRESQIRKLSDLNGFAPNVIIADAGGARPGGAAIQIRGVSAAEVVDKSHDSPIAVSIDGVFLGTTTGRNIPNFDLERVEILRGPQGTLFGKNTVGGVVNVIRTRPTGELGAKIKLTGGNNGQEEIRSVVNFPIVESLAGKAFFTQIKNDGWMRNTFTGDDGPEVDYRNYGLTLLWEPTDTFDAQLTIEQYKDDSDLGANSNYNVPAGFFPPPDPDEIGVRDLSGGFFACNVIGNCRTDLDEPDTYQTSTSNDGRYKNNAYTLNMNYDLTDTLRLVSVTGYHDTPYEDYLSELDGIAEEFILIDNENEYDQFTQEIRLEGSWREKLDWVLGGYYLDSHYEQDWVTYGSFWTTVSTVIGLPVAFDGPTADLCRAGVFAPLLCDTGQAPGEPLGVNFVQKLYQEQDTESYAVFAQGDYALTDQWTLTAGIRYTDESKDFTGYQSYLAPLDRARTFNFPERIVLDNDWQETTIRLGARYQLNDDVMFYASYAEGFKSGGFFGRNQNISDFEANQYDPEESETYEVGMKSQWLENTVQLNVAVFYNNFDDKQDSNVVLDETTGTVATVWENIGGVDYTGVELEARWAASANLDLWASAGYLDADYDDFLSSNFIPIEDRGTTPPENVDFLTVKNAPEWTFGLGGSYAMELGPGQLRMTAKYNFIDDIETTTYNEPLTQVDSRDIVDAAITYSWRNFTFSAFGNNLTDETFEIPSFVVDPWLAWSNVSRGRTYGAELEVEF